MKKIKQLAVSLFLIFSFNICFGNPKEEDKWKIKFNTNSLRNILLEPETILENPRLFWATDSAYILSKGWHNVNKISLDDKNYYDKWLTSINEFVAVPENERKSNPAFQILKEIENRIPLFEDKSIKLLNDFLPQNDLKFNTTIYFTTKTYAFAFMHNSLILSDVLSPYFEQNPDKIFNSITHECFHLGYGFNRYLRKEMELENSFIYNTLLDGLQNEGIATYLGYLAKDFFPSENDRDYLKLNNQSEVKLLFQKINGLFEVAEQIPLDSLQKKAWEIGVVQRGYYIVGASMAKTIDEKLGRESLIETIATGPLNFVEVYNELAETDYKIFTFTYSKDQLILQQIKKTVIDKNPDEFQYLIKNLAKLEKLPTNTEKFLVKLGYQMIYLKDYFWAIEVFKRNTELFPESANAYDCLAEAYLKSGDKQQAIKFYNLALKKDPEFENAKLMLTQINKI